MKQEASETTEPANPSKSKQGYRNTDEWPAGACLKQEPEHRRNDYEPDNYSKSVYAFGPRRDRRSERTCYHN